MPEKSELVDWAKQRALAELAASGPEDLRVVNALTSLQSDLRKHPATQQHDALELGSLLAAAGQLRTERQVREWIEGVQ